MNGGQNKKKMNCVFDSITLEVNCVVKVKNLGEIIRKKKTHYLDF